MLVEGLRTRHETRRWMRRSRKETAGLRAGGRLALSAVLLAPILLGGCASGWFGGNDRFADYRAQQRVEQEAAARASEAQADRSMEERVDAADRLRRSGQLDRAVYAYLQAYRRDQQDPVPLERIGYVQLEEDPARAQITFEQLVETSPERASAHAGLGLSYYAQGRLEPARASLERALALEPESPLALSGLAAVQDLLGRDEEAAALREQLAVLRPRDPRIANDVGVSRMLRQDWAGAEEALRRAVQLDPRDLTSWNNLALVLGRQDRWQEALTAFRHAGDEQTAQNNLGYLYYRAGRYEEAIAAYEAALLAGGAQKARVMQNLEAALDARGVAEESGADANVPAAPR